MWFFIGGFLVVNCSKKDDPESKRYCSYLKYESNGGRELSQSETILRIIYENWESDSVLFVHYYNDTVLDKNSRFNEWELFNDLDNKRKWSKYGHKLNFKIMTKNQGQYNLQKLKWFNIGNLDSIPVYIFDYYPEKDEYDMDNYVLYNPDYGIMAEYSPIWNNLILLDSIFNNGEYPPLLDVPKKIINDSIDIL